MRINVRAVALKTRVVLAEMASFAGHFCQNNKKFWGPQAPNPPLHGVT